MAKQSAAGCFLDGWNRFAPYLAVIDGKCSVCHRWSWRILQCRLSLSSREPVRNVSKSSDMELSKSTRGKRPSHCVGSERACFMPLSQKIFYSFEFPGNDRLITFQHSGDFRLRKSVHCEKSQQFKIFARELSQGQCQLLIFNGV